MSITTITDKEVKDLFAREDIKEWAEEIEDISEEDKEKLLEHVIHLEKEGTNWWLLLTKYLLTKPECRKKLLDEIRSGCIYK